MKDPAKAADVPLSQPQNSALASAPSHAFRPRRSAGRLFVFAGALLIVVLFAGLFLGQGARAGAGTDGLSAADVMRVLIGADGVSLAERHVVLTLRFPKIALMALVGAALAAAGAAYQGLFRNPLADPYIIGVASGAGLGATCVLSLGLHEVLGMGVLPLFAFIGGIGAVSLVLAIAQVGRSMPVTTMLLAGVAVASLATALQTFWMLQSREGLQGAFGWLVGGYSETGWKPFWIVLPYFLVGLGLLQLQARGLNLLQLDEEQARQLGVRVERVKLTVLAGATLMTAAAVSFGGLIGFVGLVIPHICRILGGPDYRRLILLSALVGGTFLILADRAADTMFDGEVYPVGTITAFIGAPFFLVLLRRVKRSVF